MTQTRSTRLVGRSDELLQLQDAVESARGGVFTVVLIEGEPGIGKSRLVREATSDFVRPGDALMVGHGVDLAGEELPFGVVAGALRDLVRREGAATLRAASPTAAATLGALLPDLAEGATAQPSRAEIFDAFVTLIEAVATDRLTWLVVEDLHWSDMSSRDLLAYLVRVIGPARLLVTCTLRSHDRTADRAMARLVDELAREPAVRRMHLDRLSRDDVAAQMRDLLKQDVGRDLLNRAVELAQGIPFLTEELVLGGLRPTGPLPANVSELMLDRVDGLSRDAVMVTQASSLASGRIWHGLLASVCELPDDTMAAACAEAVDTRVLEVDETGVAYRFRHTLLREVVRAALLPADRLRWHERWAKQLEADESSPDREFGRIAAAHHWAQTGDVDRAFSSTLDVATVARSVGASSELAVLMQRILQLWPRVPDAATRAGADRDQILDETIDALIQSDAWAAGLTLIDEELAGPGDKVRRTALLVRRAWFVQQLGLVDATVSPNAEQLLALLIKAPASPLVVEALIRLGFDLVAESPELAQRAHARSVEIADALARPRKQFWAREALALHLSLVGHVEEAIAMTEEVLPSVRLTFPSEASVFEADCTWWLCCLGRHEDAIEVGTRALHGIGRPEQARRNWALATANLSAALMATGKWDQVAERLDHARTLGVTGTRASVLDVLAGILACYRGDLSSAEEAARAARAQLPGQENQVWPGIRGWVRWLYAEIAAGHDDIDAVRHQVYPLWEIPGLEIASDILWRPLLLAARLEADLTHQALGRRGGGRPASPTPAGSEHMETLRSVAARLRPVGALGAAWTAQFDAESGRFEGSTDPGPWTRAAQLWEDIGQVHDQAWALLRESECGLVSGDRRGATTALRQASVIAEVLGARPLISTIVDVVTHGRVNLEVGGDSPSRARSSHALSLTTREIEVLTLVAGGRSNEEIGRELFISPKTASVHVSHILAKLGARSRTEAAATAHRLRLLH